MVLQPTGVKADLVRGRPTFINRLLTAVLVHLLNTDYAGGTLVEAMEVLVEHFSSLSAQLTERRSAVCYKSPRRGVAPMLSVGHPEDPPSYNAILATDVSPMTYSSPPHTAGGEVIKGVPPGLQYLLQINQLSIHERFSVSQGRARSFDVLDHRGQRIYQANQHVECCGPTFDLRVRDNRADDVMGVTVSNGCGCSRQAHVTLSTAGLIGSVAFPSNAFITHLSIMSPSNEVLLLILGPSLKISIFGSVTFEVKSRDEQHVVGMIRNEGNRYTITFPKDMEVTMKAMLLASCFYLDALIYDQKRDIADRPSSSS
ncbi:PREDICTED: phospholipid scramblase 1-like [Nanorana parkeri]|uniref:phospholipid scramblase 1-like n=1 Tax=Nanorana parkeri TaxID=125878 RepID=UPI000854B129|nr:PREDICTED: phospholipid scramblase 1-like [Nanorana parkeri]